MIGAGTGAAPVTPTASGTRTAIVGKGGVGKTTVTGLLSVAMVRRGLSVLAVDADEQRNLAAALGLGGGAAEAVVPVGAQAAYVEEKTGARPGEGGGMLRLNPDASDVADRLSVRTPAGARLLVMGGVDAAGGGCLCPEHALLAAVVRSMRLQHDEAVLMDTHAGVEHFGRALARGFDQALVVVDPSANALGVGAQSARLAVELGIGRLHLLVNRVRHEGDLARALAFVERETPGIFATVRTLPYEEDVLMADGAVAPLLDRRALGSAVERLADVLLGSAPTGSGAG